MVTVPLVSHGAAIYFAWSRLGETTAPLEVIENRFPTLFEGRRMLYPRRGVRRPRSVRPGHRGISRSFSAP